MTDATGGSSLGSSGTPAAAYLARRALRFWPSAAIVFGVMVVATLIFARLTWQPYKSEAVLMYAETVPRDMPAFDVGQAGARLKEMLHSTERIRQAIAKYNLFPEYSTAQAIEEVKKRLDFQIQPGGTFSLSYIGFSPKEAQAVLRDLTDGLLVEHNLMRGKKLKGTRETIEAERTRLEEEVRTREAAVKAFVGQHPEVATLNEQGPLVVDPRIALLEQELKQAVSASSSPAATGEGGGRSIAELIENKRQTEQDLSRAQRDLQDKLITLTEAHPDVIGARDRVARLQQDVNKLRGQMDKNGGGGSAAKPGAGREEEVRGLRAQIDALRSAGRRPKDPKTLQLGVQYEDLRHNLQEARTRLSRLQDQEVQMSVAEKMEKSGNLLHLTVHDPASLPGSPLQSRRRRTAMGGLFLAGLLAAGTALARALASDRIFDRHDVIQMAGAPVLTVVPALPRPPRGRRARA